MRNSAKTRKVYPRPAWRDVCADARTRVGDTLLPHVDRSLLRFHARKAPWLTGTVEDALALPARGWVVGHFAGVVERSRDCQVKLWSFTGELGDSYPWKRLDATEIDFVYAGVLNLALRKSPKSDAEYVSVRAGNWLLVRRGTCYRALSGDHAAGMTVRWPSRLGSKKVMRQKRGRK